jgi:hypothetical protein
MIPEGTRFIGISPNVNLTEKKSAILNAETQPYTIDDIKGYKVYTALLTQTSTSAPTSIVLENTLGAAGSFSYQGVGVYNYTNSGVFTSDKTIIFCTKDANEETPAYIIEGKRTSDNVVQFIVKATTTNTLTNGALSKANIEIRVYN